MPLSSDVIKGLASGALALAGTLISLAASWAKELNASAQRMRALEEATKRATFWDTWLKAQLAAANANDEVSELKMRARAELSAAAIPIEEAYRQPAGLAPASRIDRTNYAAFQRSVPRLRRWLLLYKPPRPIAWVPRVFFYLILAESIAIPFILLDPAERSDWQYAVIGFAFLLAVFRGLSVWAERPRVVRDAV